MKPSTQIYPGDSNKSTRPILSDMLYAIPHNNVERRAPDFKHDWYKHDWYDKHDYLRLIYWRLMPYNIFFFTVSSELHMLIRLSISNNNWFQVSKQFNFILEDKKKLSVWSPWGDTGQQKLHSLRLEPMCSMHILNCTVIAVQEKTTISMKIGLWVKFSIMQKSKKHSNSQAESNPLWIPPKKGENVQINLSASPKPSGKWISRLIWIKEILLKSTQI